MGQTSSKERSRLRASSCYPQQESKTMLVKPMIQIQESDVYFQGIWIIMSDPIKKHYASLIDL